MRRFQANRLLLDGKPVATATLLPDWTLMHGNDIPLTIVTGNLLSVEEDSADGVYPFGQYERLSLESGNPSIAPVQLQAISSAWRIASPASSVRYVRHLLDLRRRLLVYPRCCSSLV